MDVSYQDSDNLSTRFTIPKKSLDDYNNDKLLVVPKDVNEQKEILDEIFYSDATYLDRNVTETGYSLVKLQIVKNLALESNYAKQCKSMIEYYNKDKKSKINTKIKKRKAFYIVESEEKMNDIIKNGFECISSDDDDKNILNHSEGGIHFCKYLDVALLKEGSKCKKSIYCIVVEMLIGKLQNKTLKSAKIEEFNAPIECDALATLEQCKKDQPIEKRYKTSLIYKYDIEDETYKKKLNSVLPLYVLYYEAKSLTLVQRTKIFTDKIKPIRRKIKFISEKQFWNSKECKQKYDSPKVNENEILNLNSVQPQLMEKSKQMEIDTAQIITINKPIETEKPQPKSITKTSKPGTRVSTACIIETNFIPATTQELEKAKEILEQNTLKSSNINSDDSEEEIDSLTLYKEYYHDVIESLYVKPSRWRMIYEITGRMDFKFKADKKMAVRLDDIKRKKFKYIDEKKSRINLKDSTNKLILTYQMKRIKKLPCLKLSNNEIDIKHANDNLFQKITSDLCSINSGDVNNQSSASMNRESNKVINKPSTSSTSSSGNQKAPTKPLTTLELVERRIKANALKAQQNTQPIVKTEKLDIDELQTTPNIIINNKKSSTNKAIQNKSGDISLKTSLNSNLVKPSNSKEGTNGDQSGLSSEMTSLEARLLRLNQNKSLSNNNKSALLINQQSSVSSTSINKQSQSTVLNSKLNAASNTPSNSKVNSREDLKKSLESSKSNKTNRIGSLEQQSISSSTSSLFLTVKQEPRTPNLSGKDLKSTELETSSIESSNNFKRKKSFWEPDSDTEYDKIKKQKNLNRAKTSTSDSANNNSIQESNSLNNDKENKQDNLKNTNFITSGSVHDDEDLEDGDDDIVIVSKLNLNMPPIQYSKQFYDLNINGFESELKKFDLLLTNTSNGLCEVTPFSSSPSTSSFATNKIIKTITKSPIKSTSSSAIINPLETSKQRRLNLSRGINKQRFIHHITTSYAYNHPHQLNQNDVNTINQCDVDELIKFKSTKSNISINGIYKSNRFCKEIHAGGFSCIEEHKFQHTINYLRRTQSFNAFNSNNTNINHLNFDPSYEVSPSICTDSYNSKAIPSSQSVTNFSLLVNKQMQTGVNKSEQILPASINKRISLNDYKIKTNISSNSINTPPATSQAISVKNCDTPNTDIDLDSKPKSNIKFYPDSNEQPIVHNKPINDNYESQSGTENINLSSENQSKSPLVNTTNSSTIKKIHSFSLIDELKKQINNQNLSSSDQSDACKSEKNQKENDDIKEKSDEINNAKSGRRKKKKNLNRSSNKRKNVNLKKLKTSSEKKRKNKTKKKQKHSSSLSSASLSLSSDSSLISDDDLSLSSSFLNNSSDESMTLSTSPSISYSSSSLLLSSSASSTPHYKSNKKHKKTKTRQRKSLEKNLVETTEEKEAKNTDKDLNNEVEEEGEIIDDEDDENFLDQNSVSCNTKSSDKTNFNLSVHKAKSKKYKHHINKQKYEKIPNQIEENKDEDINLLSKKNDSDLSNNLNKSKDIRPKVENLSTFYNDFQFEKSIIDEPDDVNLKNTNKSIDNMNLIKKTNLQQKIFTAHPSSQFHQQSSTLISPNVNYNKNNNNFMNLSQSNQPTPVSPQTSSSVASSSFLSNLSAPFNPNVSATTSIATPTIASSSQPFFKNNTPIQNQSQVQQINIKSNSFGNNKKNQNSKNIGSALLPMPSSAPLVSNAVSRFNKNNQYTSSKNFSAGNSINQQSTPISSQQRPYNNLNNCNPNMMHQQNNQLPRFQTNLQQFGSAPPKNTTNTDSSYSMHNINLNDQRNHQSTNNKANYNKFNNSTPVSSNNSSGFSNTIAMVAAASYNKMTDQQIPLNTLARNFETILNQMGNMTGGVVANSHINSHVMNNPNNNINNLHNSNSNFNMVSYNSNPNYVNKAFNNNTPFQHNNNNNNNDNFNFKNDFVPYDDYDVDKKGYFHGNYEAKNDNSILYSNQGQQFNKNYNNNKPRFNSNYNNKPQLSERNIFQQQQPQTPRFNRQNNVINQRMNNITVFKANRNDNRTRMNDQEDGEIFE